MKFPNHAVILCGGKGERMRPITLEIPKILIPVQGRSVPEHLFDLLKKYNISSVTLSLGYMKENIKAYFGDGLEFGIKIDFLEEGEPLGTGGPLRLLKNRLKDTFIVSNGDELKDIDLDGMYKIHSRNKALITLALKEVEDPSAYGVVRIQGNRVLGFVEKPKKDPPSNLISAGFYFMEPEVLDMIPEGFAMLEKSVFPKAAEAGRLFGYRFPGQWFDTGTFERYEKAIREWRGVSK